MNLICITESELSQWVSRRYFDTLAARILDGCESVTADIFCTSPYLKLEDARGRIIINLKYNWKDLRHYVDAGSTYSYSGVGTTFSDVSGFTFNANLSPTFSSVIKLVLTK